SGCSQNALIARYGPLCAPAPTPTPCNPAWRTTFTSDSGGYYNDIYAVAVVAVNDIWAVGMYAPNSYAQTLILHWDGTQWSIVPSPIPGTLFNSLNGVAAVASNDAWAVGYYQVYGNTFQTLTEHWNGTSWSIVPSPNPGSNTYLYAVVALAANDV